MWTSSVGRIAYGHFTDEANKDEFQQKEYKLEDKHLK